MTDWEAVVVDDGSTDTTYNIARAFGERDPRIWAIRLEKNEGAAKAVNHALPWPVTKGKYLMVLAADDYLLEDFMEKCVTALDANPLAPGAYTNYIEWYEAEGIKKVHRCPTFDRKTLLTRDFVNFSALVFRFVALFDDSWTPVADWDAVIRMTKYRPLVHLPEILAVRRIHSAQVSAGLGGPGMFFRRLLLPYRYAGFVPATRAALWRLNGAIWYLAKPSCRATFK